MKSARLRAVAIDGERFVQQRLKTAYSTYRPAPATFKLNLLPYEIKDGMVCL